MLQRDQWRPGGRTSTSECGRVAGRRPSSWVSAGGVTDRVAAGFRPSWGLVGTWFGLGRGRLAADSRLAHSVHVDEVHVSVVLCRYALDFDRYFSRGIVKNVS